MIAVCRTYNRHISCCLPNARSALPVSGHVADVGSHAFSRNSSGFLSKQFSVAESDVSIHYYWGLISIRSLVFCLLQLKIHYLCYGIRLKVQLAICIWAGFSSSWLLALVAAALFSRWRCMAAYIQVLDKRYCALKARYESVWWLVLNLIIWSGMILVTIRC